MYYRHLPYPYYNLRPYFYRFNNGQISYLNQQISNFGTMNDVNQNAVVNQLMAPEPEAE